MIPYVILAIIVLSFVLYSPKLNSKGQNHLYYFLGILLAVFIIFRSPLSNHDIGVYIMLYEEAPSTSILFDNIQKYNEIIRTEFSYSVFCTFLKSIIKNDFVNLYILVSSYALLGLFFKLKGISMLTDLKILSFFIYFCHFFMLQELIQMRAGVAIGLVLISIAYLQREEYGKYLLILIIAGFFHSSAYLTIILPFFKKFKVNYFFWGFSLLLCIIINSLEIDIIHFIDFIPFEYYQFKLKSYIQLQEIDNVSINYWNIPFIIQNLVIVLVFIYKEKLEKENPHINILLNMLCFSSCCFIFFGQIPGFAFRISEIFNSALIILIPTLIKVMKPKAVAELIIYTIGLGLFYINTFHSIITKEYYFFWS